MWDEVALATEFVSKHTDIPEQNIAVTSNLWADLRLDSFDKLNMIMEIESFLERDISDADAMNVQTVLDLALLIRKTYGGAQ